MQECRLTRFNERTLARNKPCKHSYIHESKVATRHAHVFTLDRTQALRTDVRFIARTVFILARIQNERLQIEVYARSSY
jgi:hypothetical protein